MSTRRQRICNAVLNSGAIATPATLEVIGETVRAQLRNNLIDLNPSDAEIRTALSEMAAVKYDHGARTYVSTMGDWTKATAKMIESSLAERGRREDTDRLLPFLPAFCAAFGWQKPFLPSTLCGWTALDGTPCLSDPRVCLDAVNKAALTLNPEERDEYARILYNFSTSWSLTIDAPAHQRFEALCVVKKIIA